MLSAADRPNIVVILADDLGYGDLSTYGGWIPTPHIDQLAKGGARFTDFHSNGAVCSPTRAGLVTGKYPHRVGIPSVIVAKENAPTHQDGIRYEHLTFAELMRDAGYQTAIVGKWHLGYYPKHNPIRHGFLQFRGYVSGNVDYFSHVDQVGRLDWWNGEKLEDEPGYTTHLITQHAVEFIDQHADRPFCLYVAHEAPHYPYQGPHDKPERIVGKAARRAHGDRPDKKQAYREMVTELDLGIGQIIDTLRDNQIDHKTLVFFFSDNGATSLGSNKPLRGHKGSVWEGGHRVPAVAYWPGRITPSEISDTAMGMDLAPTMVSLAVGAVSDSYQFDGIDLTQRLLNGIPLPKRTLVWQTSKASAVREGTWKLVTNAQDAKPSLFNLERDLGENENVIDKHPNIAKRLESELSRWRLDVLAH